MTTFPRSPRIIKCGIVLIDPENSSIKRIIALQYNPETLTRSFQVQGVGGEGDTSEALRLTGPPIETINLEAEIDATDQLEAADSDTVELGIQAQLAALETVIYPSSDLLISNNSQAASGNIEIIPMETALTLFIWNKNRIMPVRLTEFSITEEAFDVNLNPIRAKVSIGMRVLNIDDVGFDHKAGNLFMSYQQNKERLAERFSGGSLRDLGIENLPL